MRREEALAHSVFDVGLLSQARALPPIRRAAAELKLELRLERFTGVFEITYGLMVTGVAWRVHAFADWYRDYVGEGA